MKKVVVALGVGALYLAIGAAGARLEGCQKCEQRDYPPGCYCAQVPVGYQHCETSQGYSSCEDCQEQGSCPSGGGVGGSLWWYSDPFVNLDDGSSCSGGFFCPAECSRCW